VEDERATSIEKIPLALARWFERLPGGLKRRRHFLFACSPRTFFLFRNPHSILGIHRDADRAPVGSGFSPAFAYDGCVSPMTTPSPMTTSSDVTALLQDRAPGESPDVDRMYPLVYDMLRDMARKHLARHGASDTLNTTSLVHEAYLKLSEQSNLSWSDRIHFLAIASRAMRYIIVDYVRYKSADKRGGSQPNLSLEEHLVGRDAIRHGRIVDLNDALEKLEQADPRAGRVVECRFFGGLTVEETAEALGCSGRTVKRDWRKARMMLFRMMKSDDDRRTG
jgi:RNA polymerase sigma factor (TIGR02999 family)